MILQKLKVVLIEDHILVRKGLRSLLELEPDIEVIGEGDNGYQAISLYEALRPDITILDIALPRLNGIEAAKIIRKSNPIAKILILSAYADDGYVERVMDLHLSGYLVKQCSPHFLIDAIHRIALGKSYFCPTILEKVKRLSDTPSKLRGEHRGRTKKLSVREAQILQAIAEGMANKQIAYSLEISIKTVEKHRQNLMKKLSIHDTAGLTRYAIAEGYIENRGPLA